MAYVKRTHVSKDPSGSFEEEDWKMPNRRPRRRAPEPLPPPPPESPPPPAVNNYVFRQHQKWMPNSPAVRPTNTQPMRRSISFLERDPSQPPRILYECWPEKIQVPSKTDKKMNRSKSFLNQQSSRMDGGGEGNNNKVRRMLKKSASILYPSWLAAHKKSHLVTSSSQQTNNNNRKESKVEELSAMPNVDEYGWEPVLNSNNNVGKKTESTSIVIQQQQQLPRLSERNRLPLPTFGSPTTVDHPATKAASTGSILSTSTSSAGSSSGKWHRNHYGNKKVTRKASTASNRRWQSLIALSPDASGSNRRNPPGSVGSFLERRESFASSRDEDEIEHYQSVKTTISSKSQSSLVMIRNHHQDCNKSVGTSVTQFDSGPSYESLDDYLLSTPDHDRNKHQFRRIIPILPAYDSFESLPRPPPPADADYSPPDISPDSSENKNGGNHRHNSNGLGGKIRNKLQRLPTFIQRQEAWQRKTLNSKRFPVIQDHHNIISSASPSSPEPWLVKSNNGWRYSGHDEECYDGGEDLRQYIPMTTNHPAVYWHDWLPPPADLLDCGCGLCRLTAAMNSRPPQRLPPLPPRQHHQHNSSAVVGRNHTKVIQWPSFFFPNFSA